MSAQETCQLLSTFFA